MPVHLCASHMRACVRACVCVHGLHTDTVDVRRGEGAQTHGRGHSTDMGRCAGTRLGCTDTRTMRGEARVRRRLPSWSHRHAETCAGRRVVIALIVREVRGREMTWSRCAWPVSVLHR